VLLIEHNNSTIPLFGLGFYLLKYWMLFVISTDTGKSTFGVTGDFGSPWKEEVDTKRKYFSPVPGHPQVLQSPPKTC